MPEISLTINDRGYEVICDPGQEEHLHKLAEHIDERVRQLAGTVGTVSEARLLVMASLIIADELFEAYKQIHAQKAGADPESVIATSALEVCTQRVEALAARLGGA